MHRSTPHRASVTTILMALLLLAAPGLAGCSGAYFALAEMAGKHKRDLLIARVMEARDDQQADIVSQLNLLRPIYRATTNYGHFGKSGLPWEQTNKVAALRAAVK